MLRELYRQPGPQCTHNVRCGCANARTTTTTTTTTTRTRTRTRTSATSNEQVLGRHIKSYVSPREYERYLLAALEREGCGLYPPPSDYFRTLERRLAAGYRFLHQRWPNLTRSPPSPTDELAQLAGLGQHIGEELCFQLCDDQDHLQPIADACALVSLMIAYFDYVLDERPDGAAELLVAMSRPKLLQALNLQRLDGEKRVFENDQIEDPLTKFVVGVAEELFSDCRRLGAIGGSQTAWSRFRKLVLEAYDAQLQTRNAGSQSEAVAAEAVRRKNTRTTAMAAAIVLLSPNGRADVDPDRALAHMEKLGDLFGLADDLVDLVEDIGTDQANALVPDLLDTASPPIRQREPGEVVSEMIQQGIIDAAVNRLCTGFASLHARGDEVLRDPGRFGQHARRWLAAWFTSPEELGQLRIKTDANSCLERAVRFLASIQQPDGSFRTDVSHSPNMDSLHQEESVYIHAFVISCLGAVRNQIPQVAPMLESGTAYLRETQERDGWWRFFGSAHETPGPDVDDTAVALAALIMADDNPNKDLIDRAERWVESLETLRAEGGLFKTWADPSMNKLAFQLPDAAVNANLLHLQGLLDRTDPHLVAFFERAIELHIYHLLNLFGVARFAIPYLISRCCFDRRVEALARHADHMSFYLTYYQGADGGWENDLDSAMAFVALVNNGRRGAEIVSAADWLISRQQTDGGWATGAFFRDMVPFYYGARAFTTALCVEGLSRLTQVDG